MNDDKTRPSLPGPGRNGQAADTAGRTSGGSDADRRRPPGARREAQETLPDSPEFKATQFDGNPSPQADDPGGTFHPPDDTPTVLPRRRGPRNG